MRCVGPCWGDPASAPGMAPRVPGTETRASRPAQDPTRLSAAAHPRLAGGGPGRSPT